MSDDQHEVASASTEFTQTMTATMELVVHHVDGTVEYRNADVDVSGLDPEQIKQLIASLEGAE
jgi:hypothetical protein